MTRPDGAPAGGGEGTAVSKPLTPKQAAFVREYLIDLNATQAAIRAGYSPASASFTGWDNLRKPAIAAAVARAQQERIWRTEVTQDRVVRELAAIGFSDMGHYASWGSGGVVLNESEELTEEQTRAVAEVSETVTKEGGTIRFKLHDKRAALRDLGQHLGMYTEKVEHSGRVELDLRAVAERVEQRVNAMGQRLLGAPGTAEAGPSGNGGQPSGNGKGSTG